MKRLDGYRVCAGCGADCVAPGKRACDGQVLFNHRTGKHYCAVHDMDGKSKDANRLAPRDMSRPLVQGQT
jgi:hypothetical protein